MSDDMERRTNDPRLRAVEEAVIKFDARIAGFERLVEERNEVAACSRKRMEIAIGRVEHQLRTTVADRAMMLALVAGVVTAVELIMKLILRGG